VPQAPGGAEHLRQSSRPREDAAFRFEWQNPNRDRRSRTLLKPISPEMPGDPRLSRLNESCHFAATWSLRALEAITLRCGHQSQTSDLIRQLPEIDGPAPEVDHFSFQTNVNGRYSTSECEVSYLGAMPFSFKLSKFIRSRLVVSKRSRSRESVWTTASDLKFVLWSPFWLLGEFWTTLRLVFKRSGLNFRPQASGPNCLL
jgi:hypothetical protein